MSSALDAWRAAEATLGLDVPPPPLPPRLAMLWSAMDALDRGEEATIRRIAKAARAEHRDVAALLDLLLSRPGTCPIPADLPETVELPFREVLAAVDVARTGLPAETSPRFDLAAGYRPLLHALYRLCSDGRTDLYNNPLVAAFSPRADQLQLTARAVQITGHTARARLADRLTDEGLRLAPDRWPELDRPLVDGDLLVWATTRISWTDGDDAAVERLLEASEAERRTALGALLHRFARDLRLGRLTGMARPVRAAWSLAWSLMPESDLITQLSLLQLRVDRYDPEHPGLSGALLVQRWRSSSHLSPSDRAILARALLREARDLAPPAELNGAALLLMARTDDDDEAAELLFEHAVRWPPQPLLDGLATHGASALRRVHLAGLHAASAGFFAPAWSAARRLAAESPPDADAIARIVRTIVGALARRADAADLLTATIAAIADLSSCQLPPRVWGPVLLDPELRAALSPEVLEQMRAAPHSADRADAADQAATLAAAADQRAAVRDLGRLLRQQPATAADLALRCLAWLHAWNGRSARALADTLRPLTAFLLHDPRAAEAAAARLPQTGPLIAGAVDWWLHLGQEALPGDLWRDRLRSLLAVPSDLSPLLVEVARTADLSACRSVAEAAAQLQRLLQARVDLET